MSLGRQTHLQVSHQIRYPLAYTASGAVKMGTLPKNCRVISAHCIVETGFNAGTTNTISLGYSAGGTDLFNAQAAGSTAFAAATMTAANANPAASADVPLYVQYNQSGTAPTAGAATIVVSYAPDNS